MGNCCCNGCCLRSPPIPNSQSPAGADDPPSLHAHIEHSRELHLLITHVHRLLSVIEKARSAQDVRKDSNTGFLQGWIERAAKFLEAISRQGEALENDEWALNRSGGMQTVISAALEHVGELHWTALGFSAIAFAMDSIQQLTSNFQQCVRLLRKSVDLAGRLPDLRQQMLPNETRHLNEAVGAIVEAVIACCCCMSRRKIFKYLFSPADKANLRGVGTVIDELHRSLILMVAMDIRQQIPRRYYPSEPEAPFGAAGIDDKISEVIGLLDVQGKGPARAVILYGFGGAGKTTLGDCVLSQIKPDLDLRGIKYGRIRLGEKKLHEDQQDLCAELTKKQFQFKDFKDGQEKLKNVLEEETAFIFIDNALTEDQIDQLLPPQLSLPSKSRLLLTSRSDKVIEQLRSRNIGCQTYPVDGLADEAAKKYFRQIVIRSEGIALALNEWRISLVKMEAVAEACRGVPLLLRVYARYLEHHGSDSRVYDEILVRLRGGEFSFTDEHLADRLLYVYDRLDTECQEAFVDICTYFHGWEKEDVSYIVSTTVLHALEGGALVKVDASNKVIVHDVLKAMGINKGRETRMQSVQDLGSVQHMNNIQGIWLPDSRGKLESETLIAAKNGLRVLALGRKIRLTGRSDLPFPKLRFLHFHGLPVFDSKLLGALRYLRIETKECADLNLKGFGQLQKFAFECWEMKMFPNNFQLPTSLIELDLSNCTQLQELPAELCILTQLSKLRLDGCKGLKILPEEFYKLTELTYLSMEDCHDLQMLPVNFGQLSSLQRLNLSGSSFLETLGADFGGLSSLESLSIRDFHKLVDLPESFGDLSMLSNLTIKRCKLLRSLPDRFGDLRTLKSLDLSECQALRCLPDRFDQLSNLQSLDLNGCQELENLPDGLGQLSNLQSLNLRFCCGLVNLPCGLAQLSNLQSLNLFSCKGLKNLPGGLGQLANLQTLDVGYCAGLETLPGGLGQLNNLLSLHLCSSQLTTLPHEIAQLGNLEALDLCGCSELTSLPHAIGQLGNLENLNLARCSKLTCLPHEIGQLSHLRYLGLTGCSKLASLPDEIGQLGNLKSLSLSSCPGLRGLPRELGRLSCLQYLSLNGCKALSSLPNSLADLTSLHRLSLNRCSTLTTLPDPICQLNNLQTLKMRKCSSLTSLPSGLGYLSILESLDLKGCNGLTSLPDVFGHLSKLQYLDLRDCSKLISLPNGFGDLKLLKMLLLSGCTSLSVLPESFGNLSALNELEMTECLSLKMLPNNFEDLRSVEYLDLSGCTGLEGNAMESVVKLRNLKMLDIRDSPNLTKKWREMGMRKSPFWVQSTEPEEVEYWQGLITAIGTAILQHNSELVDVTGESIHSADFIQPGMTVAFLFNVRGYPEEMFQKMMHRATSEKWQIIYIEMSLNFREREVDRALQWLPDGSRAIAPCETDLLVISDYFPQNLLDDRLLIADVRADDEGGRHFVSTEGGSLTLKQDPSFFGVSSGLWSQPVAGIKPRTTPL